MIKHDINEYHRPGCKDIWNAFIVVGASFGKYDIPFCPTTATRIPDNQITWEEAKQIHKKHIANIIPAQMANHPVLQKIGMNLDDASNGVFLRTPGKNISAMSRHRGFHSIYSEFVKQELNKINLSNDSATIQKQVHTLQKKLRKLQNSGLPLYSSEGATVDLWRKHYNKLK